MKTFTDYVGNIDVQPRRIDDGGSGRAKSTHLSTRTDQFGVLEISIVATDLIDTDRNVISEVIEVFYATIGVTLTLKCS